MLLPDNHVTTLMQLDYQEALFYFQGGTGGVGFGIGNIFRTLI
jgi:hypothetical protein